MNALLHIQAADVRFGRVQALRNVHVKLHPGERLALVGGNGSGKSTLLRLANGLVAPTAGVVTRQAAARQAFVFQKPFVLRSSVLWNVALAAWLGGQPWGLAKAAGLEALQQVGLADLSTRNARTLSGGQQQRLAFARALCTQPDVLLLDEPTASLSPQAKRDVEALMQHAGERGATLVFASHNLGQVKRLATRVLCLDAGEVVADLPVHDFFTQTLPERATHFLNGEFT